MVKIHENPWIIDGNIDVQQWLEALENKGYFNSLELIKTACLLVQSGEQTINAVASFQQGLSMAALLADLEVDQETLTAAIIFPAFYYKLLPLEDITTKLGNAVTKLVIGADKMGALSNLSPNNKQNKQQIDIIRKMLLAMVDDVRVVLIKLVERLCILRSCNNLPLEQCKIIANEVMEIYAPLANRLGIGAIKWEMEDLAFRYLHPNDYKEIAQGLKSKRLEREKFVNFIVEELNKKIQELNIYRFAVYGRAKHIHSIYRKMTRKNLPLAEIYDAIAVRILVATKKQCYETLSMVHTLWEQIAAEFDDYIAYPKPNGYQSLHTAVRGPEEKVFEVQIRTFKMHELAEMGVAAHWKYKEGAPSKQASYERKISWLRDVLSWHQEMVTSQGKITNYKNEFLEDRVYIFTPDGEVLDLPQGATTLDFAYYIHSNLGHRCRGAKVNNSIVPLNYTLRTGDQVEVLTGKEIRPSRDWLNSQLHYVKTARAKAKINHWFKMQDYDKNKDLGLEILEPELRALNIKGERLINVAQIYNFKTVNDLLAALGRGDIKLNQILNKLSPLSTDKGFTNFVNKIPSKDQGVVNRKVQIAGVSNLLTNRAQCCQPVLGDEIIGYITVGKGVSIHRQDCPNILHADAKQRQRFIGVDWPDMTKDNFIIDLLIKAYDRFNLAKDITSLLAYEKNKVYNLISYLGQDNIIFIQVKLEVKSLNNLAHLVNKLAQIPNVIETRRHYQSTKFNLPKD